MKDASVSDTLANVAVLIEQGAPSPELRRLVDRKLLHGPDGTAGPLAFRLTELAQRGDDDTLLERARLHMALATLGRLMRYGAPDDRGGRKDAADILRAVAAQLASSSEPKGSVERRKPGRPANDFTKQRADFRKHSITQGYTEAESFELYRDKFPADTEATADRIGSAYRNIYGTKSGRNRQNPPG